MAMLVHYKIDVKFRTGFVVDVFLPKILRIARKLTLFSYPPTIDSYG